MSVIATWRQPLCGIFRLLSARRIPSCSRESRKQSVRSLPEQSRGGGDDSDEERWKAVADLHVGFFKPRPLASFGCTARRVLLRERAQPDGSGAVGWHVGASQRAGQS